MTKINPRTLRLVAEAVQENLVTAAVQLRGAAVSKFHLDTITDIEDGGIVDLFSDVDYEPTFRQDAY